MSPKAFSPEQRKKGWLERLWRWLWKRLGSRDSSEERQPLEWAFPGRAALDIAREKAAVPFKKHSFKKRNLYSCCAVLLQPTEIWEKRIDLWLQGSKAARALIFPFLVVGIVDFFDPHWVEELLSIRGPEKPPSGGILSGVERSLRGNLLLLLGTWWLMIVLSLLMLLLYLVGRIRHMLILYGAAATAEWKILSDPPKPPNSTTSSP
jgi:hypothetical protein